MNPYQVLADAVLLLHFIFVVFIVLGLLLTLLGGWRGWRWVGNGGFRLAHLAAIGFVAIQAWLGQVCPLTILEMRLRREAGQVAYEGSFIQHWVGELLYYSAPPWVFASAYTAFALLVMVAWFLVPPRLPWQSRPR